MKSLFVAGFALLLALSAQAQDCPECHKLNTKDSTLKWDTPAENLNSIVTKFSGAGGLLSYTAPRVSQETIDQSSNSTPQDLRGPVLNVPPPVF